MAEKRPDNPEQKLGIVKSTPSYQYPCLGCGMILVCVEVPSNISGEEHYHISRKFEKERDNQKRDHEVGCLKENNPSYNPEEVFIFDISSIKIPPAPYKITARFRKDRGFGYNILVEKREAEELLPQETDPQEIKDSKESFSCSQEINLPKNALGLLFVVPEEEMVKKKKNKKNKKKRSFSPKTENSEKKANPPDHLVVDIFSGKNRNKKKKNSNSPKKRAIHSNIKGFHRKSKIHLYKNIKNSSCSRP